MHVRLSKENILEHGHRCTVTFQPAMHNVAGKTFSVFAFSLQNERRVPSRLL